MLNFSESGLESRFEPLYLFLAAAEVKVENRQRIELDYPNVKDELSYTYASFYKRAGNENKEHCDAVADWCAGKGLTLFGVYTGGRKIRIDIY